jgi:WhiB family redox-sensing transcriptional regulator
MTQPIPECGTYSAYNRHYRRKEPIDSACRAAATEYMRAYRKVVAIKRAARRAA